MSLHELIPTSRLNCDHGLRRQTIVASLLADVFEGRLRAGQRLVTQDLASRFGVSHTPIREALIAVAGLGVVDLHPNKGAVVRRVTPLDVSEVCQVRRLLECEAVRLACGRIDPVQLRWLSEGLTRQLQTESSTNADRAGFVEEARVTDSRLHDMIAASSGSAFLAHELTRLKTLFRAFRDVSWAHDEARNDYRRLAEESREHSAIVSALTAGDAGAAARALSRHIMAGAAYWSRVLLDNRDAPPEGVAPGDSGPRPKRRAPAADRDGTESQSRTL